MGDNRVKLTKYDKAEWGENWHYESDILFEWLHGWFVILLPYYFLHCEKVNSYEKFSHNLTLIVQLVWKISAL